MKNIMIKKILSIILVAVLTCSACANYIKSEKIILKINDNITLKSKINTYCDIVKLFTKKNKIKKIELKNKIIKEVTIFNAYCEHFKNYNIKLDKESLHLIYKDSASKKYLSLLQFKKIIEKKYKIKSKFIKEFIINNIAINKMQKTLISEDIILSDKEISNFFNISNYKTYTKNLFMVKVLEISFVRQRKKNHLKILKQLINNLDTESDIEKIKSHVDKKLRDLGIKIVDLNDAKNKHYYFLKYHLDNNISQNIIGPFFLNNYIYLYKIIDKKNKTDHYKSYIKINYNIIQKKKLIKKKNTFNFLILNKEQNNINIYKKTNTCWIDKENTTPIIYDTIKNLKINDVSNVIETNTGWYIIKVIDRIFDHNSNIYTYIVQNIMSEKIKLLTQQFENKIIKNINIKYYID